MQNKEKQIKINYGRGKIVLDRIAEEYNLKCTLSHHEHFTTIEGTDSNLVRFLTSEDYWMTIADVEKKHPELLE